MVKGISLGPSKPSFLVRIQADAPFISGRFMWKCKHCSKDFDFLKVGDKANHSRWCFENPKRQDYCGKKSATQLNSPASIEKRRKSIADAHLNGKYKGAAKKGIETKKKNGTLFHNENSIEKIREKALASGHRRLLKSTRFYTQVDGTQVLLDSSWEESLARRLDSLGVAWLRPKNPIKWVDGSGKIHNYFPDFYLPIQDLYLDPKNPHAAQVQKEKLNVIKTLLPNLRIITTLKECEEFCI